MKVQCGQCPAKYAVSDDRIAGKKVRLRCKRCGASIVVNGKVDPATVETRAASKETARANGEKPSGSASVGSPSAPPDPEEQAALQALPPSRPPAPTMLGGLEAPLGDLFDKAAASGTAAESDTPELSSDRSGAPSSQRGFTAPPPADAPPRFRVAVTKQDLRWMTRDEVQEAHRAGVVQGNTFVFVPESDKWEMLVEIAELSSLVKGSLPPPRKTPRDTPAPSSRPPPRRSRPNQSLLAAAESILEKTDSEADSELDAPDETVPFSLDASRSSNRPPIKESLSFAELAERNAHQPSEPAPEELARHLTSPPEALGASPSLTPPSLSTGGSGALTWLLLGAVLILAAGAGWFYRTPLLHELERFL